MFYLPQKRDSLKSVPSNGYFRSHDDGGKRIIRWAALGLLCTALLGCAVVGPKVDYVCELVLETPEGKEVCLQQRILNDPKDVSIYYRH